MAITSDVTASGATITSSGGKYSVLSGATLVVQGAGYVVSGPIVSGFGNGPNNSSGTIPGQSGGTNYPALVMASAGGIVSGPEVGFGGAALGVYGGTVVGGMATNSGSIAAINGGFVDGATIGSMGAVYAGGAAGSGGGPGVVRNTHVQAGGYGAVGGSFTVKGQAFAGPGIMSGGTFDVGSTELVNSAGTEVGSLIGGTQIVSSAGTALKSIFSAGTQILQSGGFASGATALANGLIMVSGGTASAVTLASGGSLRATASGLVTNLQVQAAAAASADSAAVISNVTISGGGTFTIGSGATLVNAVISGIDSGGSVGGLLVLQSGAVLNGVTSMGYKSRLDIDGVQYVSGAKTVYSGNTLTITDASGNMLWSGPVVGVPAASSASDFRVQPDSDGSLSIVYDKCFLKGTMIRTEKGECAVEDLAVGDRVAAFSDGKEIYREIIWIGHRAATIRPGLHDDECGYPVRIVKDAFGENVPYKDLLVTPEHAIFLNNAFVPARMLVNGRSIYYDRSISHFEYFHVETDQHSIIWSDGALSESYLDTGDRLTFSQNDTVVRLLNAPAKNWEEHAAAPLRVERDFVEPLFAELSERAEKLTLGVTLPKPALTEEADLRLVDDKGREIRTLRIVKNTHVFMVPSGAQKLYLASRISRPIDVVGPYLDDRRELGVLVGQIQVWEAGRTRVIDAHLTSHDLSGWAGKEEESHRWTTGYAELPWDDGAVDTIAMVSIEILAGGPYMLESSSEAKSAVLA